MFMNFSFDLRICKMAEQVLVFPHRKKKYFSIYSEHEVYQEIK